MCWFLLFRFWFNQGPDLQICRITTMAWTEWQSNNWWNCGGWQHNRDQWHVSGQHRVQVQPDTWAWSAGKGKGSKATWSSSKQAWSGGKEHPSTMDCSKKFDAANYVDDRDVNRLGHQAMEAIQPSGISDSTTRPGVNAYPHRDDLQYQSWPREFDPDVIELDVSPGLQGDELESEDTILTSCSRVLLAQQAQRAKGEKVMTNPRNNTTMPLTKSNKSAERVPETVPEESTKDVIDDPEEIHKDSLDDDEVRSGIVYGLGRVHIQDKVNFTEFQLAMRTLKPTMTDQAVINCWSSLKPDEPIDSERLPNQVRLGVDLDLELADDRKASLEAMHPELRKRIEGWKRDYIVPFWMHDQGGNKEAICKGPELEEADNAQNDPDIAKVPAEAPPEKSDEDSPGVVIIIDDDPEEMEEFSNVQKELCETKKELNQIKQEMAELIRGKEDIAARLAHVEELCFCNDLTIKYLHEDLKALQDRHDFMEDHTNIRIKDFRE